MSAPFIQVKNLKKYFETRKGPLHAVDDVSFDIRKGETLGLVGESGCGKSTTGRAVIRLLEPSSGQVLFDGKDILLPPRREMKAMRSKMQMVFQDPYSSLNPRLCVADLIAEPLEVKKVGTPADRAKRVRELADIVGLSKSLESAYPHELDGGRRQRVGIARALALNPEFIVLDEPVSALDVCIQAQVLNLLDTLQKEMGLTYLFISHDLSVVHHVSDRIAVMYLGRIVEMADYKTIFSNPVHAYTKALLSAITIPKPNLNRKRLILEGDVPSPINPPAGCRFAGRCYYNKVEACTCQTPELKEVAPGHFVACHLADTVMAADLSGK
ncbi:oligopeptide/dipeptide ABC transporter ATP-binding protein [uncultured Pseudodesulfovibrio sp.]|uniref:ABC transporter ATP-binding protein n=1 Tax=uncultured Pseudodesulfovibrio sp. TaxID=2035858 RepID=UPI0029C6500E|nr:oligopeptide/dipeptide ABC transporter ATP-binding protein [uncultured Pseudodesulfovibrio sp.]